MNLVAQIVALHQAFDSADLPHAFGGALALAFCTEEPRGTKDIDVNVFIRASRVADLEAALPSGVSVTAANRADLARDAQTRLWWGDTPVDVFLSNHPFHDRAEANRRGVPFAGLDDLPVLACTDLAVFKAFFARPKDAVDVATMAAAGSIDVDHLERLVTGLLGTGSDRADFFDRVRGDLASGI